MLYAYAVLLVVVNAFWLFLVILGLPGTWLMLATTALLAWWQWVPGAAWSEQVFHPATLAVGLLLALLGELLEFVLGAAGSKRAGGSWLGAIGAIVGGIVGGIMATFMIPIPIIGSLIGACIGAFVGAALGELAGGQEIGLSLQSGRGAAVGRFWGTVAKLGVGIAIWALIAVAVFWP